MLQTNRVDRFTARFGLTAFDLLVISVIAVLVGVISVTAVFGIADPVERVAYLQLDDRRMYEVWIANPENLDDARQVTQTEFGVWDYDVSRDGRYIVYSERDFATGSAELYLIDLATDQTRQITTCRTQDADCYAPKFSPDGRYIAYERTALNSDLGGVGPGAPRIWLIDTTADPPTTFPLIDTGEGIGTGATWSANGERIAFYDNSLGGIVVYAVVPPDDDGENRVDFIPSQTGLWAIAPDGEAVIYPEVLQQRGYLQIYDLEADRSEIVTDPNAPVDDQYTAWSPDGQYVAIARRQLGENAARGAQIYLLDTTDNLVTPLLVDLRYTHGFFQWNVDSNRLTMHRFRQLDAEGNPYGQGTQEVWMYDLETRRLTRIAEQARNPLWLAPR
ncbi:MAG: TolB family protein [Chloroflexota bacterium]